MITLQSLRSLQIRTIQSIAVKATEPTQATAVMVLVTHKWAVNLLCALIAAGTKLAKQHHREVSQPSILRTVDK